MLGFPREEIRGANFLRFIAAGEKSNTAFEWTLRQDGFQNSYETALIKKTGEEIPVLISPQRLVNDSGEFSGSLAVVTDISRNKEVEIAQKKKIEELASLRRIDTAILTGTTLKSVISVILNQFRNELKADALSIHIFHPQSTKIRLSRGFIQNNDYSCAKTDLYFDRIRDHNQDCTGRLYQSDLDKAFLWKRLSEIDIQSLYIAPILVGDNLKGIIEVAYTQSVTINEEWLSYFNALITQTAVGVEKTELIEKLQTRNKDLQEAYVSTIKGWANALELRDEETRGHSDRVVQMAVDMARKFGISGENLEHFRDGALLHDIGKMGVPDGILLKPGKLTEDEWVVMKKHPVFAYNLLKGIPFLSDALEIPYYHHERWDGSGYPQGLRGESIPLSARIFAVVDVWDALTSDRPYRPAWSKEETLEYLVDNREKQFDPHVVDVFLDMLQSRIDLESNPGKE
jgi:HD-GYP domain-containing protein (c-di-GMP phosphodiesterase class II)